MSTHSHFSRLWGKLREFCIARKGNVALTFGVAAIPIVCAVGAAIDYTHAASVKAALQSALDATALMMQREAATDTPDQLQNNASQYFHAIFNRPEAQNVTLTATFSQEGGSHVTIEAAADVPTNFMSILGSQFKTLHVRSTGAAKWGSALLRVALVLDNTGSMRDDGKMDALHTATKNLLDQLKSAATDPGDVYVSIIPFAQDIKVGTYDPSWDSWIYWDDTNHTDDSSWDARNGTCKINGSRTSASSRSSCFSGCSARSGNTCTTSGSCSISSINDQSTCESTAFCSNPDQTTKNSCENDKACSKAGFSSKSSCERNGGKWGRGDWTQAKWSPGIQATWTPDSHSTWIGCIMDRGGYSKPGTTPNYDQNVDPPLLTAADDPATQQASGYPPDQSTGNCPSTQATVMGLNYDWDTMKTLVQNMTPTVSTNQPIGLVWGWLSLHGGGPFTAPAEDPDKKYAHIIILLSDGLNTKDRWYGDGSHTSTDVDKRMYDNSGNGTCKNIKDQGITIYAIQVNTGGDPLSTLLQNCASSSDKFFELTSADEIVTTFQQIGTDITKLHLSQ